MVGEIYSWTLVLLQPKQKSWSASPFTGTHVPPFTPPPPFIFTLEIPSRVPPGSVWWTTSVSARPHPGSPHPEPPSSHNIPPAKTPSANPSQQLMAKVFPLQAGFRWRKEPEAKPKAAGLTESHLSAPHSWTVVVFRVWEWRPLLPYKSVRSHVPVLHKHTCLDTHLPASCYFS